MRAITFYFDYISPYSYLAWQAIHPLAERHKVTVEPMPILFAGLLNHHGQKGGAEVPPKRPYVYKDCLRTAHVLGVPFQPPPSHPFNPLLALRVSSLAMEPEVRRRLIDRLYSAAWGEGVGVTEPEVIAGICDEVGVAQALERAADTQVKEQLRAQTFEAISRGLFGVPTMLVGDELFWGVDSLPHLERFLEGNDPVTKEDLARWAEVPVGAQRQG